MNTMTRCTRRNTIVSFVSSWASCGNVGRDSIQETGSERGSGVATAKRGTSQEGAKPLSPVDLEATEAVSAVQLLPRTNRYRLTRPSDPGQLLNL
jgi:hypothetical protein